MKERIVRKKLCPCASIALIRCRLTATRPSVRSMHAETPHTKARDGAPQWGAPEASDLQHPEESGLAQVRILSGMNHLSSACMHAGHKSSNTQSAGLTLLLAGPAGLCLCVNAAKDVCGVTE